MAGSGTPPVVGPGFTVGESENERHRKLQRVFRGKHRVASHNAVTLEAGGTTTTLADELITAESVIALMPMTANAAAALASTFVLAADITPGQAVITHANNAQTDRTFRYSVHG